ncbi:hypothetical protein ACFQ0G_49190 [Streptomyces chiangmaiensis]
MHGRSEPDDGRADAAFRECDHRVLGVDPRPRVDHERFGGGVFQPREGEQHGSRRGHQRLAGASERVSDRLDGAQIRCDRAVEVAGEHGVVLEGQVDDAVGRGGGRSEAVDTP